MKNFLRKMLGFHELEHAIARLNSRIMAVSGECSALRAELHNTNQRHTRLQSQMIAYSLQQRRKEAAYEIQSVTCDLPENFADLAARCMESNELPGELKFKPAEDGSSFVYNRPGATSLAETFNNTVTDRACESLKVADPLPGNHYAVTTQATRNKRYSTLAASECAALHVPYSHAEWRSVSDHYSKHSPSWFCPELVTLGQVRNRAMLLADEEKLELKQVKNAKRTWVNSYPAPLLIRAQFELHNEAVQNTQSKDQ